MATLHVLGDDGKWYFLDCTLKDGQWYDNKTGELIDRTRIYWVS